MKIISGAQTGADRAGLEWAHAHRFPTGGWMPKDFRAEDGNHPEFAALYGIKTTQSSGYPPRTEYNVRDSDGTIIFGNANSPGCRLTLRLCIRYKRPCMVIPYYYGLGPPLLPIGAPGNTLTNQIVAFTRKVGIHEAATYNIAGNRESKAPGIHDFTMAWLQVWWIWWNNEYANITPAT